MRESAEVKGRRYLTEGRLTIERLDGGVVYATCRGTDTIHRLGYDPTRREWRCSCPARGRCAHLVALQLVTRRPA